MSAEITELEDLTSQEYKYGWTTDIEQDSAPPGLNEDIVRFISAKKKNRNGCSNGASRPTATG